MYLFGNVGCRLYIGLHTTENVSSWQAEWMIWLFFYAAALNPCNDAWTSRSTAYKTSSPALQSLGHRVCLFANIFACVICEAWSPLQVTIGMCMITTGSLRELFSLQYLCQLEPDSCSEVAVWSCGGTFHLMHTTKGTAVIQKDATAVLWSFACGNAWSIRLNTVN